MSKKKLDHVADTNGAAEREQADLFEFDAQPIRGFPELHWAGKRPFRSAHYYPAQLAETFGVPVNGWSNKIFWGDNLQVMSHLLREFRGKVQLVYIDPPFDSGADYKKTISLGGSRVQNDHTAFEEKQYADIWSNDDYLQFMYERLILIHELIADSGSIFFHCDWHKIHHMRCLLDEIFGPSNFQNEVIWQRTDPHNDAISRFGWVHDNILWYAKKRDRVIYNWKCVSTQLSDAAIREYSLVLLEDGSIEPYSDIIQLTGRRFKLDDCTYKGNDTERQFEWRGARPSLKRIWPYRSPEEMDAAVDRGEYYLRNPSKGAARCRVSFLDQRQGQLLQTIWTDAGRMKGGVEYPTQKPKQLLDRIIKSCTNPGDLVFDAFMGSGTAQAVAMRLGRRFLGADINLGAIETTKKRLITLAREMETAPPELTFEKADDSAEEEAPETPTETEKITTFYTGFDYYVVNNYNLFRNELEAREILLDALEVTRAPRGSIFDGELDGWMVKLMPPNRIATREDLNDLLTKIDIKTYIARQKERPGKPVEKIQLVCMGHEPGLGAHLKNEMGRNQLLVEVEVLDVLRDRSDLQFKRDPEARVVRTKKEIVIKNYYPMNLLQKLSLMKESVEDWRELVQSILVDFHYNGQTLNPTVVDVPERNTLVTGRYPIPGDARRIAVKITDLLDESILVEAADGKE
jgi:site-specific DNA-methyltransferase (adenine-specific)/adenine-specific DNA-methyltransferase